MTSLPADVVAYRRTPEFTESTVPAALLRAHRTKPGVWGRIRILEGALRYRTEPGRQEQLLEAGVDGIIAPQVEHEVEPVGAVRFFVEFLRAPREAGS